MTNHVLPYSISAAFNKIMNKVWEWINGLDFCWSRNNIHPTKRRLGFQLFQSKLDRIVGLIIDNHRKKLQAIIFGLDGSAEKISMIVIVTLKPIILWQW